MDLAILAKPFVLFAYLALTPEDAFAGLDGKLSPRLEHVVPRGVVTQRLLGRVEDNRRAIERAEVIRAIELFRLVCLVTPDERELVDATYDVDGGAWQAKTSMPSGWDFWTGDLWARFKLVRRLANGPLSQWHSMLQPVRYR